MNALKILGDDEPWGELTMPEDQKMLVYIGTKIVCAKPMTQQEFQGRQGETETGPVYHEGYMVVYPDGYESWSPKAVFEEAYRLISDGERRLV